MFGFGNRAKIEAAQKQIAREIEFQFAQAMHATPRDKLDDRLISFFTTAYVFRFANTRAVALCRQNGLAESTAPEIATGAMQHMQSKEIGETMLRNMALLFIVQELKDSSSQSALGDAAGATDAGEAAAGKRPQRVWQWLATGEAPANDKAPSWQDNIPENVNMYFAMLRLMPDKAKALAAHKSVTESIKAFQDYMAQILSGKKT